MFFCLLTPTLRQLVFKQKKTLLRAENSALWKVVFGNLSEKMRYIPGSHLGIKLKLRP